MIAPVNDAEKFLHQIWHISLHFYFVSSTFRSYRHLLTSRRILQHLLAVVFTRSNENHGTTSALMRRSNPKAASSTNSHWLKASSWARTQGNESWKTVKTMDWNVWVSGRTAQWKCTLEGCLTDLWRLIFFRLKSRAGETWTCIGTRESCSYHWSIKDQNTERGEMTNTSSNEAKMSQTWKCNTKFRWVGTKFTKTIKRKDCMVIRGNYRTHLSLSQILEDHKKAVLHVSGNKVQIATSCLKIYYKSLNY